MADQKRQEHYIRVRYARQEVHLGIVNQDIFATRVQTLVNFQDVLQAIRAELDIFVITGHVRRRGVRRRTVAEQGIIAIHLHTSATKFHLHQRLLSASHAHQEQHFVDPDIIAAPVLEHVKFPPFYTVMRMGGAPMDIAARAEHAKAILAGLAAEILIQVPRYVAMREQRAKAAPILVVRSCVKPRTDLNVKITGYGAR